MNIPKILVVGSSAKSTHMVDRLLLMEARGEIELAFQSLEGGSMGGGYSGLEIECSVFDELRSARMFDVCLYPAHKEATKKKRTIKPYFRHNERY